MTGSAASFTGSLAGDVTGTQSLTVVGDDTHAHTASTLPSSYTALSISTMTGNVTGNCSGTAANITGVAAVTHGGTGLSTIPINVLLYASAADVLAALATVLSAMLTTNGAGVPTWVTTLPTAMLPSTVLVEG